MGLKEDLDRKIPERVLSKISNRYRVIGDIAVLAAPPGCEIYGEEIAGAITARNSNIKTVLNKVSKLETDDRVAGFEILSGKGNITVHCEYGFSYRMDVAKVFFNSSLSYERNRVAKMVGAGEAVLVPFCGVGPFAVPVAAGGSQVVAVEKNPEACLWLGENAKLNKVGERIAIINGDASYLPGMLKANFDRAIVPTPYGMDDILWRIAPLVKSGGMIHFYTFKWKSEIEDLIQKFEKQGFDVVYCRRCGHVAPGVSRWVFDLSSVLRVKRNMDAL